MGNECNRGKTLVLMISIAINLRKWVIIHSPLIAENSSTLTLLIQICCFQIFLTRKHSGPWVRDKEGEEEGERGKGGGGNLARKGQKPEIGKKKKKKEIASEDRHSYKALPGRSRLSPDSWQQIKTLKELLCFSDDCKGEEREICRGKKGYRRGP